MVYAYVITMREMSAIWQTQTHQPVLGLNEGSEGSEASKWLDNL